MLTKLAALLSHPISRGVRRKGLKGVAKIKRGKQLLADEETHAVADHFGQYEKDIAEDAAADKIANFVKEAAGYVPGAGTAIGFGADIGEWMNTNLAVNAGGSGRGGGRAAFTPKSRMAGDLIAKL